MGRALQLPGIFLQTLFWIFRPPGGGCGRAGEHRPLLMSTQMSASPWVPSALSAVRPSVWSGDVGMEPGPCEDAATTVSWFPMAECALVLLHQFDFPCNRTLAGRKTRQRNSLRSKLGWPSSDPSSLPLLPGCNRNHPRWCSASLVFAGWLEIRLAEIVELSAALNPSLTRVFLSNYIRFSKK